MPFEAHRTTKIRLGYHREGFHIQPCRQCGEWFCSVRYGAKFCSNACRQAAYRERHRRRRLKSITFA